MNKKTHLGRRRFLKTSFFGLFGAGIATKGGWARTKESTRADSRETKDKPQPKIKAFRILGRTGFKASDLAIGSVYDEGLLGTMLDAGFNYIDTAESYPRHHGIVAKAIKGRDRKSIFISTKMEVKKDPSKEDFLKRARKALEELDTEYIDCMMMHYPEKLETLKTEGFHAAMKQLKSEGRLRYVGASHHGSFWFKAPEVPMDKVLLAAANGYQGAFMAPTEILAEQHFATICNLLSRLGYQEEEGEEGYMPGYSGILDRPLRVVILTGDISQAKKQELQQHILDGDTNIIIGTHALIQKGVEFHRLGLAIVDEQHRFGVTQRSALR